MRKIFTGLGILVLFLVPLVIACNGDEDETPPPVSGRVARPEIANNPNRVFNSGPIEITMSTTTADASLYYTLDGTTPAATNGELYIGPFNLEFSDTTNTPRRGYVSLRVIGVNEGMNPSQVTRQDYQLFTTEPWGTFNGLVSGTALGYGGPIQVDLTLTQGVISGVTLTGDEETPDFWAIARLHGEEFITTMNHWDLDTAVSGATFSSQGISTAAKAALDSIP